MARYDVLISWGGSPPLTASQTQAIKAAIAVQMEATDYRLRENSTQFNDGAGKQPFGYKVTNIDDRQMKILALIKTIG